MYLGYHVNYIPRPDLVPTDLQTVCVEIYHANAQSFIISSIDRPPSEVFTSIEKLIKLTDG